MILQSLPFAVSVILVTISYVGCVDRTVPRRGNEELHIDHNYEKYEHDGHEFTRVYMAIYDTYLDPDGTIDIPLNARYNKIKNQKFIFQADDGTIHSKPVTNDKKSGEIERERLWISVGKVERPLYYMETYEKDKLKKGLTGEEYKPPSIQSILVKDDYIKDVLNQNWLTTENFGKINNMDMNVDTKAPNQLALSQVSIDKLNAATLPNSLITFLLGFNPQARYPSFLGNVRPVTDLADKFLDFEGFSIIKRNTFIAIEVYRYLGNVMIFESVYRNLNDEVIKTEYKLKQKEQFTKSIEVLQEYSNMAPHIENLKHMGEQFELGAIPERDHRPKDISTDAMFKQGQDDVCWGCKGTDNYKDTMKTNIDLYQQNTVRMTKNVLLRTQIQATIAGVNMVIKADIKPMLLQNSELKRKLNNLMVGTGLTLSGTGNNYEMEKANWESTIKTVLEQTLGEKWGKPKLIGPANEYVDIGFSSDFALEKDYIIFENKEEIGNVEGKETLLLKEGKLETLDGKPVLRPVNRDTAITVSGLVSFDNIHNTLRDHFYGRQLGNLQITSKQDGLNRNEVVKELIKLSNKLVDKDERKTKTVNTVSLSVENIRYLNGKTLIVGYDSIANGVYYDSSGSPKSTPFILERGFISWKDKLLVTNTGGKNGKNKMYLATDEKIKRLQVEGKSGIFFSDKNDPVIDAVYVNQENIDTDRLRNIENNIRNNNLRSIKQVYDNEILIKIGANEPVSNAIDILKRKYVNENKNVYEVELNNGNIRVNELTANTGMRFDQYTRVTIVGHGEIPDSHLTVGGFKAEDIARQFGNIMSDADDQTILGKISIVCCNSDVNPDTARERGVKFGETLINDLRASNIISKVAIRSTYVAVNKNGQKLYGVPNDDGTIDWSQNVIDKIELDFENGEIKTNIFSRDRNIKITDDNSGALAYGLDPDDIERVMNFDDIESTIFAHSPSDLEASFNTESDKRYIYTDPEGDNTFSKTGENLDDVEQNRYIPVSDENGIQGTLMQSKSHQIAEKMKPAIKLISDKYGPNWYPNIESAELENGKTKLLIYNIQDNKQKTILMSDMAILDMKHTLIKEGEKYAKPRFSGKRLNKVATISSRSMTIFGFAMFIRSSYQISKMKQNQCANCTMDPDVAKMIEVMEINAYIGLVDGSVGATSDVFELVSTGLAYKNAKFTTGIKTVSKHITRFSKVANVFGKVALGIGAVGSLVGLGFSAYQLHKAETKDEKIEYGIQVAVDSVGVISVGVTIGVAIATAVSSSIAAGAGAAGAFCSAVGGPIGVIVGAVVAVVGFLISIVTSLIFEFKNTAKNVDLVAQHFHNLSESYKMGGIEYLDGGQILSFKEHAIVEKIDFQTGWITLESAHLYSTKYGSWGKRTVVKDKRKAINILSKLGYSEHVIISNAARIKVLVLPFTPLHYLDYEWRRLPFCQYRKGKGYKVMKQLETNKEFDYCFYRFPNQKAIAMIEPEYVKTEIDITLLPTVTTIVVPRLPYTFQKYFTYRLTSTRGTHFISLSNGVKIDLSKSSSDTQWYLVSKDVTDGTTIKPSVVTHTLDIGNTSIKLNPSLTKDIIIFDKYNTQLKWDVKLNKLIPMRVTFNSSLSTDKLKNHLRLLSHVDIMPFVMIEEFKSSGVYIGRAWYDVKHDRFMYSNMRNAKVSNNFKNSVQMLFASDSLVYYWGKEGSRQILWSTNRKTHEIQSSYQFYCGNERFNVTLEGVHNNYLLMAQKIGSVTFIYGILPEKITLVSISGIQRDVRMVASNCIPTLNGFLPQAQTDGFQFPGKCIYPDTIYLLPLIELSGNMSYHYWLYTDTGNTEPQSQDDVFCAISNAPVVTGIINPNIDHQCKDLSLLDLLITNDQNEVRFYICYENKIIYSQRNDEPAKEIIFNDEIQKVENYGQLMVIYTTSGLMYKTHFENPYIKLIGLDAAFILQNHNMTEAMEQLEQDEDFSTDILILTGLKSDNQVEYQAWVDTNYDLVIIDTFNKTDIEYKGPAGTVRYVWLYSPSQKIIVLQTVVDVQQDFIQLDDIIFVNPPFAEILHTSVETAENINGKMNIEASNGAMVIIDRFNETRLLGVRNYWSRYNGTRSILETLCADYRSKDMITLGIKEQYNGTNTFSWYHCELKLPFKIQVQNGTFPPTFLGIDYKKETVYFSVNAEILEIQFSRSMESGRLKRSIDDDRLEFCCNDIAVKNVANAAVMGNTFSVQVPSNSLLSDIPILNRYVSLLIDGGDHDGIVSISEDVWFHYDTIVFTATTVETPRYFVLNVSAPCPFRYPVSIQGNDSVFVDLLTTNLLVLDEFLPAEDGLPETKSAHILTIYMCNDVPMTFVSYTGNYADQFQVNCAALKVNITWILYGALFIVVFQSLNLEII